MKLLGITGSYHPYLNLKTLYAVMLPLVLMAMSYNAVAATITWDASGTFNIGDWITDANWAGGVEPTNADDAVINNGGVVGLTSGETGAASTLSMSNSSSFNLTGTGVLTLGSTLSMSGTGSFGLFLSGTLNTGGNVTVNNSTMSVEGGTINVNSGAGIIEALGTGRVQSGDSNFNENAGIFNAAEVRLTDAGTRLSFEHNTTNYFFTTTGTNAGAHVLISGAGFVNLQEDGETTFTGANTYTGGTTIGGTHTLSISADNYLGGAAGGLTLNGGTLRTLATFSTSRSTTLNAGGGTFNTNTGTTLTHNGVITGTGALTKQGAGILILGGANNYSGGTTVSAGTLQGTTTSLQGNITNNAAVTFDQTTNGTYSSVISGTGSLTKSNTGTVTLSGANTYSGGTTVSGGTLQGTTTSLQGNITNNAAVIFNQTTNGTYAGVMSGTGSLTKSNTGTVTLSGANTYSGGTTVSAGNLIGTTTSLQGNITNNSVVRFDQNTNGTYSDVMSGTGILLKLGTGTVTLSGANTYTGITIISSGTLSVSADNNLGNGGALRIINGGTLQTTATFTTSRAATLDSTGGSINVDGGTTLTYNGIIGQAVGGQNLTKEGTGTLILGADNTYTGTTTINAGILQLGNGGTTGSVSRDITNNSSLIFNRSDAVTFDRVISGTGTVTQQGTGTTILTGANTYSGGTTISTGSLQLGNGGTTGSITGNITNNSTLSFNRSDAVTFGNLISGTGGVSQDGTGSTDLTNTNTYSGTTTINNGTLFVNGSIANSTTTINAGGILGGTGTVGNVNIPGGIFAPGNSIGTINVTGNVDFSGGGIYQVEVDAAGNSDKINATGTATLTGGSVQVMPAAGTYNFSTDYTILTATGGLIGTFSGLTSSLAFLTPTLSYDATNVFLNLKRNDVAFSAVAGTPNQIAVANLLELLANTNSTAVQDILAQLTILTTLGAQQAYDSLSGVQHTNAQQLMRMQHQQFLQLLFNRTGFNPEYQFAFNPVQDPLLAYNATGMNAGDNITPERGWWLQGLGRFGEFDDTSNATGADYHSAGVAFGVDTEWRNWVIGIAGGFSNSDADTFAGDLDIDSFHGAVYAGREFNDGIYMNAAAGFGYHDTDADRSVTVGTLTAQASADYDALTAGVGVEVGKVFELSPSATLTPYAGIEYTNTDRDDFTESGAGVMNLSVEDEDHDSLRTTLGVRVTDEITTGTNLRIKPYAYAAYVREHLDTEVTMEAGFTGAPTSTFRIDGTDLDRDRAQVGIGINGQVNDRLSFNIGYNGEIADSDDHHGVSATVEYTW